MVAHAELAADLHLAQRPGDEGADGADGDQLPEAAFASAARGRRPYFRSGGAMLICHRFQVGPIAAPDDQRVPEEAKNAS